MRKATKNDMRQKLHHIIFIVMAALLMVGCTGKDSRSLSDVPETMVCTHADSIALAARFTGDFNHFLAVTDSLADAGELVCLDTHRHRRTSLPGCVRRAGPYHQERQDLS